MTAQTGIADHGGQRFVAIRYVGKQPKHRDTVLHRPNLMWNHPGAVLWVPEIDAAVYIRYTDIWAFASEVEVPAGGVVGLGMAGSPPHPLATDPKSPGLNPVRADLRTPAPYETDAKAETPVANAVAEFAQLEKVTADIAAQRITEIMQAIPKLRSDEFSPDSKPKCDGLKRVLGRVVLQTERDAAWALVRATLAKQATAAEFEPNALNLGAAVRAAGEPPLIDIDADRDAPPPIDDPVP